MAASLSLGHCILSPSLPNWWDTGLPKGGRKTRGSCALEGVTVEENSRNKSCWSLHLSNAEIRLLLGEAIFDGQELVDGAGESKDGGSQQPDGGVEQATRSDEESVEQPKADQTETNAEPSSKQRTSIDTRVEASEENAQTNESSEDPIRKGREIFIQGFNWESHRQRWWRLLKEKVPEISTWGFTSMWLPPFCESLAPKGISPKISTT